MGTVRTNNVQVGQSLTATNNFTLYQPTVPDGTVRLGVGNTGATTADVASFTSAGLFSFNSGYGSAAVAYGCRAWVNFNGTGTVAIRASGNVTSVTDLAVGSYTINFTNTISDANYNAVASVSPAVYGNNVVGIINIASTLTGSNQNDITPTTSALSVSTLGGGTATDFKYISVSIFR